MARTFVWHPSKGPKKTNKNELTTGKVRIKQVRSGIGHSETMKLTLSSDHRVLDGAVSARFLQELKRLLEAPMGLVL